MGKQMNDLLRELGVEPEAEVIVYEEGAESEEVELCESFLSAATRRRVQATLAEADQLTPAEHDAIRKAGFNEVMRDLGLREI